MNKSPIILFGNGEVPSHPLVLNKLESFELFTESMKINKFKLIVNFNNQWEKHKHYGINSSSF